MNFIKNLTGIGQKSEEPNSTTNSANSTTNSARSTKNSDGRLPASLPKGSFPYSENVEYEMKQTAKIYRVELEPKNEETGEQKCHSLLKLPTPIPRVEHQMRRNYEIDRWFGFDEKPNIEWTYNICMFDVSHHTCGLWSNLAHHWNLQLTHIIDGSVDVYVFDRGGVRYIHNKPEILSTFLTGNSPHLKQALFKIGHLVRLCPHKHVRVFLFTNGKEDSRNMYEGLRLMPTFEKRIDLYLLGVGMFDEDLIHGLRIRLHSGPTHIPPIFQIGVPASISRVIDAVKDHIQPAMKVRLNKPAMLMPELRTKVYTAFPGEWIYFDEDPETVMNSLKMIVEDEARIKIDSKWNDHVDRYRYYEHHTDHFHFENAIFPRRRIMINPKRPKARFKIRGGDYPNFSIEGIMDEEYFDEFCYENCLNPAKVRTRDPKTCNPPGKRAFLTIGKTVHSLTAKELRDNVFTLWCRITFEICGSENPVDPTIYDFMEKIYKHYVELETIVPTDQNHTIHARLERKRKGTLLQEFKDFISENKTKVLIESDHSYKVKMADAALKSTLATTTKVMKIKGYDGGREWINDVKKFVEEYNKIKDQICALPPPTPEESCRMLKTSFIADLQESKSFLKLIESGRFDFLQEMTFTGIPVYSPIKDFTALNPWTFQIRNILSSPNEILCQRFLEENQGYRYKMDLKHKAIYLTGLEKKSKFNIIVPIVPRQHAQLLKPLLTSDVFAHACSYCILKNACIIDRNCHLAALACIWMRSVSEFPITNRPDFIRDRILDVEANAKVHFERKTIATYVQCLVDLPHRGLQTECEINYEGVKIKSETLLKPCFLLYLIKDNAALLKKYHGNIPKIIRMILMEFIGRCVSHYKSDSPFVDFFLPTIDGAVRKLWLTKKCNEIYRRMGVNGPELYRKFVDLNGLNKFIKSSLAEHMKEIEDDLAWKELVGDETKDWGLNTVSPVRYRTYSTDDSNPSDSEMEVEDYDEPRAYDDEQNDDHMYDENEVIGPNKKILAPNFAKIESLRHSGSVGQLDWNDLKAWAQEMLATFGPQDPFGAAEGGAPGSSNSQNPPGGPQGPQGEAMQTNVSEGTQPEEKPVYLIQEDIDAAFSVDNITLYLYHGLEYKTSKDRLSNSMYSVEKAMTKVEEAITKEWKKIVSSELRPLLEEKVKDAWLSVYNAAHCNLALPLTRQQIITRAQERGIDVNEETFDKVYKYNATSGLSRNACHVQQCRYFLQPNRHLNAHLEVERMQSTFPHTLHLIVSRNPCVDVEEAANSLSNRSVGGTHKRKNKFVCASVRAVTGYVTELKKNYQDLNKKQ